jgi:hypothetical protein
MGASLLHPGISIVHAGHLRCMIGEIEQGIGVYEGMSVHVLCMHKVRWR